MRAPLHVSGLQIGAASALASAILDKEQRNLPPSDLYVDSWALVLFNLLFLGPFVRAQIAPLLRARGAFRIATETLAIVTVHSGLYALAHRAMHRVAALRPIHWAHHRFKKVVVPSSANAVSPAEFLFAYMLPFAAAAAALKPSGAAVDLAVLVVSAANLWVHSPHWSGANCPAWLVHPTDHLEHHRTRVAKYAAPTFAWYNM